MRIRSDDIESMQPIPEDFALGKPGPGGEPVVLAPNRNPHLAWSDVPTGARSFVLILVDTDVPTKGDDVNQQGRHVPASLPRRHLRHGRPSPFLLPVSRFPPVTVQNSSQAWRACMHPSRN